MFKIDDLKFDKNGLIPVVCQSYLSGKVLMQAYANMEALKSSISTGFATYYSRSRKSLWQKGESSGNVQRIVDIRVDCDEDCLLYSVIEQGPACHTGNESCFYRSLLNKEKIKPDSFEVLNELYRKVQERLQNRPEGSYVVKLFDKGSDKVIQKVGEEATEIVIALKNGKKEEIIYESADLFFHLLMALVDKKVSLEEIFRELLKRYK
ncbi:MAG: bifunctional phosphoribosyl-AMP cyclohydrolase/phosphoribosyl-ATP diphosphatase HisIE [Candidatus Margulisbacteria bacterium]|nr:bifunctional phosphoribosyl-AMP cyclohydrolase/phosphoribosyl-ATP diphosphatase HisIE [Candidatus Margulisiibacteriota bacterium]